MNEDTLFRVIDLANNLKPCSDSLLLSDIVEDVEYVKLGKYNQLEVVKEVDFGVYLDGGDDGEILLPTRYVPEGCKPDADWRVCFHYRFIGSKPACNQ